MRQFYLIKSKMDTGILEPIKKEPDDDYFECKSEPLEDTFIFDRDKSYIHNVKQDLFVEADTVAMETEVKIEGAKSEIVAERSVRKVQKLQCKFCNQISFKEPLSLDGHILRCHSDVKNALDSIKRTIFSCNFCFYRGVKKSNFTRHMAVHKAKDARSRSDVKIQSFGCYHCSYITTDKSSITKHVRLHGSYKNMPFACIKCELKFNEKNTLNSHIVKNHGDDLKLIGTISTKIYKCDICEYKDVNKSKLTRHTKTVHQRKSNKFHSV